MKVLMCIANGRILPFVGTVYDGYTIIEMSDSDGKRAIEEGLLYQDGKLIDPPIDLDFAKEKALERLYGEFVRRRDSVRWVVCEHGTYGFDCVSEDRSNFMQAFTPLLVAQGGSTLYKVWLTETTKGVVSLSYQDMKKVYETVRDSQFGDYAWFEQLRSQIATCSTVEELENLV